MVVDDARRGQALRAGGRLADIAPTMLTLLGLEQHHAFSALSCPGYKHFMRLRVRREGDAIDGWVIGMSLVVCIVGQATFDPALTPM